jgi:hypothetical protein
MNERLKRKIRSAVEADLRQMNAGDIAVGSSADADPL